MQGGGRFLGPVEKHRFIVLPEFRGTLADRTVKAARGAPQSGFARMASFPGAMLNGAAAQAPPHAIISTNRPNR
jgi:hypothetical protein